MTPQTKVVEVAAAAVYLPGVTIAWFAKTLPVMQWTAAAFAIAAAAFAMWRGSRKPKP